MAKRRNITATRKSINSYEESEIEGYKYYVEGYPSDFYYATKIQMANQHKSGDTYYSKSYHGTIEAKWQKSSRGEWFLKTIPNNTENDNLLELPDC